MIIDIGEEFSTAEEQSIQDRQPLPEGVYELMCTEVVDGITLSSGRPRLTFTLEVVNNEELTYNGKVLLQFCPLPHNGNTKGIGFLVDVTKALGIPWTQKELDTDLYIGATCSANIIQRPDQKDPSLMRNNIKSFI